MSVHVMVAIFDATGLTSTEKLVALAYAEHGHDDGTEARAGIARICQYTALTRRTVQTTLRSLVKKGVLEVEKPATNKWPTVYRFLLSPDRKSLAISGGAITAPQESGGATDDAGGATDDAGGATDDILGRESFAQTVKEPSYEPSVRTVSNVDVSTTLIEAEKLCSILQGHVIANGFKPFTEGKSSLGAMERLLRIDDRTFAQVKYIIEWCQKDEFWLVNIRSPQKLRDKFDTLLGQALKGKRGVIKFLDNDFEASPLWDGPIEDLKPLSDDEKMAAVHATFASAS